MGEPGTPGETTQWTAPDREWLALGATLHEGGELYRPGERRYSRSSAACNLRYADVLPSGIVACSGPDDVVAAIGWAREQGMPFALRSGGHSYAGYSSTTGLLIDLRRMNEITVSADGDIVTVGAGATQAELHQALRHHGRTFPSGRCPSVALGGLVLGGGIGFSGRKLGLTCDRLVETDVLTAAGEILSCSDESHEDLFWACRGGGGGNFGVSTSYTLRTAAADGLTMFDLCWDIRHAQQVVAAAQEVMRTAPDELGIRVDLSTNGTSPGEIAERASVGVIGQLAGRRDELEKVLAPLLAIRGARRGELRECTYWEAIDSFAEMPPIYQFAVKSLMVEDTLSAEAVVLLVDEVLRWPGSDNEDGAVIALFGLGGAIGRVAPDATAFAHRGAAFILALEVNWMASDSAGRAEAGLSWLERLYEQVRPHASDAAYQNFPDPDLKHWRSAYYGANYDRLVDVKRAYDPDNVFHFEQSIGS